MTLEDLIQDFDEGGYKVTCADGSIMTLEEYINMWIDHDIKRKLKHN